MLMISKEKYNAVCRDYKGTFNDYHNEAPHLKGRRTWLTKDENGATALLIEGVHFLVDGDFSHLPGLTKENACIGFAYGWCDGYQILEKLYSITEEFAEENWLCYLDRATTTAHVAGRVDRHDFAISGSRTSQWSKKPATADNVETFEPIPF